MDAIVFSAIGSIFLDLCLSFLFFVPTFSIRSTGGPVAPLFVFVAPIRTPMSVGCVGVVFSTAALSVSWPRDGAQRHVAISQLGSRRRSRHVPTPPCIFGPAVVHSS